MLRNKGLIIVGVFTLIICLIAGIMTFKTTSAATGKFQNDGYILVSEDTGKITDQANKQYYFNGGEKYKQKYPSKIVFDDKNGDKVAVDKENYVHYGEGSIGALSSGVIIDVDNLKKEDLCYYDVSEKAILEKNGTSYAIDNLGEEKDFSDFVWKISDSSYLVASETVKLYDGQGEGREFPAYAEIDYVDQGVANIISQEGTYQTISPRAYLQFANGVKLYISSKDIMQGKNPVLNLTEMVIGSDDNIELIPSDAKSLEKEKKPEYQFDVTNGTDGDKGKGGKLGEAGEAGTAGDPGEKGTIGKPGDPGQPGAAGAGGGQGANGKPGVAGPDAPGTGDGGNDNPTLDPNDVLVFPDFVVTFKDIGSYYVDATLEIVEKESKPSTVLLKAPLKVKIVDAVTGNLVYESALDETALSTPQPIKYSALLEDTQYIMKISGLYEFKGETAEREFASKLFSTKSMGIKLSKTNITQDSLSLIATNVESQASSFEVVLYDDKGTEVKRSEPVIVKEMSPDGKQIDFNGLNRNTKYFVKILAQMGSEGGLTAVYYSPKPDSYKTLKAEPVFGKLGFSLDQKQGAFILKPETVKDLDSGILSYRYEFYDATDLKAGDESEPVKIIGEPKYSTEKTNLTDVTVIIDGSIVKRETDYKYRIVALFDDNDKKREIASGFSDAITMGKGGFPTVFFTAVTNTATEFKGTVNITDKNASMSFWNGSPLKLQINCTTLFNNESVVIEKTYSKNGLPEGSVIDDTNHTCTIPIVINGLLPARNYNIVLSDKEVTVAQGTTIPDAVLTNIVLETMSHEDVLMKTDKVAGNGAFDIEFNLEALKPNDENSDQSLKSLQQIGLKLECMDGGNFRAVETTKVNSKWEGKLAYANGAHPKFDFKNNSMESIFIITPKSFGLTDKEFQNYADKTFRITILNAIDYTKFESAINIKDGESKDYVEFKISPVKPVVPENHDTHINAEPITNEKADTTNKDANLGPSTIVGYTVNDKLTNNVCTDVKYYMYRKGTSPQKDGGGSVASSDWIPITNGSDGTMAPTWTVYLSDKHLDRGTSYYFMCEYKLNLKDSSGNPLIFPYDNNDPNLNNAFLKSVDKYTPKQMPAVYMYPWKVGENSQHSFRYTAWDPDSALEYDGENVNPANISFYANGLTVASKSPVPSTTQMYELSLGDSQARPSSLGMYVKYNIGGGEKKLNLLENYSLNNTLYLNGVPDDKDIRITPIIDKDRNRLRIKVYGKEAAIDSLKKVKITIASTGRDSLVREFSEFEKKTFTEEGVTTHGFYYDIPLKELVSFAGTSPKVTVEGTYDTGNYGFSYLKDNLGVAMKSTNGNYFFYKNGGWGITNNSSHNYVMKGSSTFAHTLDNPIADNQKDNSGTITSSDKVAMPLKFNHSGALALADNKQVTPQQLKTATLGEEPITGMDYVLPSVSAAVIPGIDQAKITLNISQDTHSAIHDNKLYILIKKVGETSTPERRVAIDLTAGTYSYECMVDSLAQNTEYVFWVQAKMSAGGEFVNVAKIDGTTIDNPFTFNTTGNVTFSDSSIVLNAVAYSNKIITLKTKLVGIKFLTDYPKLTVEIYSGENLLESITPTGPDITYTSSNQAFPGGIIPLSTTTQANITVKVKTKTETILNQGTEIPLPLLELPKGNLSAVAGFDNNSPSIKVTAAITDNSRIITGDNQNKPSIAIDIYKENGASLEFVQRKIINIALHTDSVTQSSSGYGSVVFTGLDVDTTYRIRQVAVVDQKNKNLPAITATPEPSTEMQIGAETTRKTFVENKIIIGSVSADRVGSTKLRFKFDDSYRAQDLNQISYSIWEGSTSIANISQDITGKVTPLISDDEGYYSQYYLDLENALPDKLGTYSISVSFRDNTGVVYTKDNLLITDIGGTNGRSFKRIITDAINGLFGNN